MNKKTVLSLVVIGVMALPFMALALTGSTPPATGSIADVGTAIGAMEKLMWIIFAGIAVIMFVVAGILFLSAGGDPEKIATARNAFIWGVAGVVVAIVAYSIIAIVGSVFSIS